MEEEIKVNTAKRTLVYLVGMVVYTYGVCLQTRAHVGISPVTSVAYILTFIFPLTLGQTQFLVNIVMVLLQILLLGRNYRKDQLLQLVAAVLFSVLIDLIMPLTSPFEAEKCSLLAKAGVYSLALLVMSVSLSVVAMSRLWLLPADGVGSSISEKFRLPFGSAKIIVDCSCVLMTVIISFACLGRLESVSVGTVISAVVLGSMIRFFTRLLKPIYIKLVKQKENSR